MTLCPGDTSVATVAYYNTGSLGWVSGRLGQSAFLGTWNPEPGQDQPSMLGGDGTHGSPATDWPRFNRIATQPAAYVGPGQVAWFQFRVKAPSLPGTYRLALRPLIEGATWMEDYGVFWVVRVPSGTPSPDAIGGRNFEDQVDDLSGEQIHYMYVLPSDGLDERLDVNGAIATSVTSIQSWLAQQTAGRRLRVDTFQGRLDISFFRLAETDAEITGSGAYVRDRIEAELKSSGLTAAGKLYGVFYGGGSTYACGGGAWPPVLPGIVGAMYLKGTPRTGSCASNPVGASANSPGYEDFAMLHELLHTMGIVGTCAPHHTLAGHVADDPSDLMYAGPQSWRPSLLDVGHDDYYGHTNSGCIDLANLPWLGR